MATRLQRLADHQAILEQMGRYTQAIDRCDLALLQSVFHSDGQVQFGTFNGNAAEFCVYNIPFIKENLVMGWHRIASISIDFQSPTRATAESYMLGNAAAQLPDGSLINCPDGMRYIDTWEKRDGQWRIAFRALVMDWNSNWPYSGRSDGFFAQFSHVGQRNTQDLSYSLKP